MVTFLSHSTSNLILVRFVKFGKICSPLSPSSCPSLFSCSNKLCTFKPFCIESSNAPLNDFMLFRDRSASNQTVRSGNETSNLSKTSTELLWNSNMLIVDRDGIWIFIGILLLYTDLVWVKYSLDKLDGRCNTVGYLSTQLIHVWKLRSSSRSLVNSFHMTEWLICLKERKL